MIWWPLGQVEAGRGGVATLQVAGNFWDEYPGLHPGLRNRAPLARWMRQSAVGRVLMLIGRGSAAASGAVIQNGMPPVVLPPAYFRKPSGLWERTRASTFGRAALGYDLVAHWATWRRGGGRLGGHGVRTEMGGGAEGARSESPYVVSYKVMLGRPIQGAG